jgi:NADP-dependent 3-hydroxy acid dehydrogenase YdfG
LLELTRQTTVLGFRAPIELDVISRTLVGAAMAEIIAENGRLDIVVQNAGHVVLGAAEAFTPEQ